MVGGVGVGVGVGPVVAVVDEGGLGKRFWIKARNHTAAVLYSPFFVSLASGHLLPETFRHCISQDVHFLRAYAQAWVQNVSLSLSLSLCICNISGFSWIWKSVGLWIGFFVCLFCFGRYEMAENCADDDEDKSAIRSLRKRVLEKLKAHPTLVQVS